MIFVSVGTQLPFERLVKAMDNWSGRHPQVEVFAQVGQTRYQPRHMRYITRLGPQRYEEILAQSCLVVSHVGIGTIIKGLENTKPMILMPRMAARGEHRNDHQLGTAKRFCQRDLVTIVSSADELEDAISTRVTNGSGRAKANVGVETSPALLRRIRAFVSAA